MEHIDSEVQLGATVGSKDHSDDAERTHKLEIECKRNIRCLEMYERELEECEKTLRDREIERPQRDRARHNSSDCQPGKNAEGYVLRQLV